MLGVPVGGWKVWPLNSPAGRGGWGSEGQPWVKMEGLGGLGMLCLLFSQVCISDGSDHRAALPLASLSSHT